MYFQDEAIQRMIGKTISSVVLDKDKDLFTINFTDGFSQAFTVDGDCCSHSWIEHMEAPNDVVGAVFTGFREMEGKDYPDDNSSEYEVVKNYQSVFETSRGGIHLEFRNSSNGYYGGWLYPVSN